MSQPNQPTLPQVLRHLESLPRAKPPSGLLARIEAAIKRPAVLVSPREWRSYAAAVVLLFAVNLSAIMVVVDQKADSPTTQSNADLSLISNFQLYDYD